MKQRKKKEKDEEKTHTHMNMNPSSNHLGTYPKTQPTSLVSTIMPQPPLGHNLKLK